MDALVDVQRQIPTVVVELRYASEDNFTKQRVYAADARCELRQRAVDKLRIATAALAARGLRLKLWDCYRPHAVQVRFWKLVPDPRYVANPKKGSRHNRGAAVDLTLVDREGRELDMGTGFDDFSERAHRDFPGLSAEAARNRRILQDAMTSAGFTGLPTEWWHFDAD